MLSFLCNRVFVGFLLFFFGFLKLLLLLLFFIGNGEFFKEYD